jgi:hypothetical protein
MPIIIYYMINIKNVKISENEKKKIHVYVPHV